MPETFQIVLLPDAHFSLHALDAFERTQCIREVYVPNGDSLQLLLRPGCEDWSLARKRQKAAAKDQPAPQHKAPGKKKSRRSKGKGR